MWKEDLCQIQDLDTGYPSADNCAISCSWKYITHKNISCSIKYTQFPEHRHSERGSPPKPLSASELTLQEPGTVEGGRKKHLEGVSHFTCSWMLQQVRQAVPWAACLSPVSAQGALCPSPVCRHPPPPMVGMEDSNPFLWQRKCQNLVHIVQKASCKVFLCVYVWVFCTPDLILLPPQRVGVLPAPGRDGSPTAPGPSQSSQTNVILLKAAGGRQTTTAQETLPDWRLSVTACGKPDVFSCVEQFYEPPAGKGKPPLPPCCHNTSQENFHQGKGSALPTARRKFETTWDVSVLSTRPSALQISSHSQMLQDRSCLDQSHHWN